MEEKCLYATRVKGDCSLQQLLAFRYVFFCSTILEENTCEFDHEFCEVLQQLVSSLQVYDALLDIIVAPDDTPSEAEFDMTDTLIVKVAVDGHLPCQHILNAGLFELAQLVVALALEQVEQVLVIGSHLSLNLRENEDSLVRVVLLVLDFSDSQINLMFTEFAVEHGNSFKMRHALIKHTKLVNLEETKAIVGAFFCLNVFTGNHLSSFSLVPFEPAIKIINSLHALADEKNFCGLFLIELVNQLTFHEFHFL